MSEETYQERLNVANAVASMVGLPPFKDDQPIKKSLGQMVDEIDLLMLEIDDADQVTPELIERFELANADIKQKVDNYFLFFDSIEAKLAVVAPKLAKLQKEVKALEGLKKRLKDYIKHQMQTHPDIKFEGTEGKFTLCKNSQKTFKFDYELKSKSIANYVPDHVVQLDPRVEKFCVKEEVRVLSKAAIAKALDEGVEVPFASFKQDFHVRF